MHVCVLLVALLPLSSLAQFSFTLGGIPSSVLLPSWSARSTVQRLDATRVQNTTVYSDASSGFLATITAVSYAGISPAVVSATEWLLEFAANGTAPTPPLCNVSPLNISFDDPAGARGTTEIRRYLGSFASADDYAGVNVTLVSAGTSPSPAPPPPLLNATRVWGAVSQTIQTPSAAACRDACIAAGPASCNSMAWANITGQFVGCWLCVFDHTTAQDGFISWVAAGANATSSTAWAPAGGRSSNGELPFFGAFLPGSSVGYVYSVGWSGSWAASAARAADGATAIAVTHPTLCAPLLPGDALRSMRIVEIAYDASGADGYHAGVNAHRRLMTRFKLPRAPGGPPLPGGRLLGALVSSWSWIGWPAPTLENQLWHVAAVKNSTSVEAYWLDAGWFNGGFPNGVGNWQLPIAGTVDVAEFPNATLAPLGVAAHAEPNAVQFIVWFEPERVAAGTYIATHYPEFLIGNLINLGNDSARAFITTYLMSAVGNYSLDVLRLDFNTDPAANWAAADAMPGGRSGITELKYIRGLYAMWDACVAARPGLLIDDCASGGRRIDLETLSRSVPLWRSDNPGDSVQQQVQTMGLSGFAPISAGGVAGWDVYSWRSSGIVGKTIDWGLAGWQTLLAQPAAMATLRAAVAETQRLRPVAIFGDYYPLTPIGRAAPWASYQLHCPGDALDSTCVPGSGALLVFLRPGGAPAPGGAAFTAALHGIDAAAACTVEFRFDDYAVNATRRMAGAELAFLTVDLAGTASGCALVEYACSS